MTKKLFLTLLIAGYSISVFCANPDSLLLDKNKTLEYATRVNDYFMRTYPDVTAKSYVGGKERDSKIWTRGVYYEGLMSLYRKHPQENWLKYTEDWGNFHKWVSAKDNAKRHADYQCCGQAYLDMYLLKPEATVRKTHIKSRIDEMLATNVVNDWYWVDAVQMAMPIFAQLGSIEKDERYFKRMYEMYMYTRNSQGGSKKGGGSPLFNETDGLWYRDYQYDPPYADLTETDKPCYWSRGNGWVYMALARVLYYSPDTVIRREQYISDFKLMSEALLKCQREDGFWGVSLAAPGNTGHSDSPGQETSGTSLFVGGMAYGIHSGILDKEEYLPAVIKGWNALCHTAVREDGFLGYVQGAGAKPEDGQPVLADKAADFEDFGIGCFLLAAAEVYELGDIKDPTTIATTKSIIPQLISYYTANGNLQIILHSPATDHANVEICDLNGRVLEKSDALPLSEGKNVLTIKNGQRAGIHLCKIQTKEQISVYKIIL